MVVLAGLSSNELLSQINTKLRFELELENEITKPIVTLCGGDPNKAEHLFNSS